MPIKAVLLAGAALCTISAAPAFASSAPKVHVLAAHAGGAVKKSAMHHDGARSVTYTFSVSTAVSTGSSYKVKTKLARTFYAWLSSGDPCREPPKQKVKLSTKKTAYAKLGRGTESYYGSSCINPDTYYGDTYTLETRKASGKTDTFTSELSAKYVSGGQKYDGHLFLDLAVSISP